MHNGTLISDLQSLVTKFGSVAQGKSSGDVTRPEGQSLSGVTACETNAVTPPEPIQSCKCGHHLDLHMFGKCTCQHKGCECDAFDEMSSPSLSSASPSAGEGLVVDELTYRSYRHNRVTNPHIEAWRWARLFGDSSVRWMEDRYQAEIRGCDADVMTGLDDSVRCGSNQICGECLNCKSHCVCGG